MQRLRVVVGAVGSAGQVFYFLIGVMQCELAVTKESVNDRVCTSSENLVHAVKLDSFTAAMVKYVYLISVHYVSFPE